MTHLFVIERNAVTIVLGYMGKNTVLNCSDFTRALKTRHTTTATVAGHTTVTVPLTVADYNDYYLRYANSVPWPVFHRPVFHNRLDLAQFEAGY